MEALWTNIRIERDNQMIFLFYAEGKQCIPGNDHFPSPNAFTLYIIYLIILFSCIVGTVGKINTFFVLYDIELKNIYSSPKMQRKF